MFHKNQIDWLNLPQVLQMKIILVSELTHSTGKKKSPNE